LRTSCRHVAATARRPVDPCRPRRAARTDRASGGDPPTHRTPSPQARNQLMTPTSSRLRIVCTNDFLSSLSPMRTSYGTLPGGRALAATVDRLRAGQPTVWADAGDFSQGGPLSTTTGGVANFSAAGQLGIDVATIGNHEFDWDLDHLTQHRAQLPFPLICA